jgi:hypothetical protein
MPACQQPARRVAPVGAGDQLELTEVGRDRHESERRVGLSESTSDKASRPPLAACGGGRANICPPVVGPSVTQTATVARGPSKGIDAQNN